MHIIVPDAPRQAVETGTGTAGRCAPGFGASQVYATNVEGTEATKVKLVVGRQNSNMSTNLELAKRLKAHMDECLGPVRWHFYG